jgi:hypothetical protein
MKNIKKEPNTPTYTPFKFCTNCPKINMAVVCVMNIYTPF